MLFIDLAAQQAAMGASLAERISAVLAHNHYILGPELSELESRLEKFTGAASCLGCASGSSALELALTAFGLGPGDAVITTPFTFVATAESIARTGATPVFVDIEPETLNLDARHLEPALVAIERGDQRVYPLPAQARSGRLRAAAIVTVDIFGRPCAYDAILGAAGKHGLRVLEDAAQSFGATWRHRLACNLGCDAAATSFFPTKPLGCYGDGGAVFTNDPEIAAMVDSLRYHGRASRDGKYDNVRPGMNGRLDTLQAAILLAKLEIFPREISLRQACARRYDSLIAGSGLPEAGLLPPPLPDEDGTDSVWAQYTVQLPPGCPRDDVADFLRRLQIPSAAHYPRGLHMQGAFAGLGYAAGDFPVTDQACARVLSLPMHPYLEEEAQARVISALESAVRECRPRTPETV